MKLTDWSTTHNSLKKRKKICSSRMRCNSVRLGKTNRAAVHFSCGFFFSFLAIHISNKRGDLIRRRRTKDCSGATKNRSLGWRDPIPCPASKAEKTRGTCPGNSWVRYTESSRLSPPPSLTAHPPNGTGQRRSATGALLIISQPSKVPVKRFLRRILIATNKAGFYRRPQKKRRIGG